MNYRREFFKEAGEVVDVRLATKDDGSLKGFGHVEFASPEAAQEVCIFLLSILFGILFLLPCYLN
jgi:nucleolin